jgi:hypothetical protein
VIKENLEQQQKHKGHHSRHKIDPKKSPKKVGRRSKIRENNKKKKPVESVLHCMQKIQTATRRGVIKENL